MASDIMTTSVRAPETIASHHWQWRGWRVHYVEAGQGDCHLLLIHGFGASTDHWRKNIEVLSQHYHVWAIDLLGFGRSQKPKTVYTAELWRDQLHEFCRDVIGAPVVVAGNSLGGYTTLCFGVDYPDWVQGVILLNCAGPFADKTEPSAMQKFLNNSLKNLFKLPGVIETVGFVLFHRIRNRDRVREVLLKVYKDPTAVTDRLVEEIYRPAFDEGALDVFAAVFKTPPGRTLDELLPGLTKPLLLLWGEADPWMTVSKAKRFCEIYPQAQLAWIDAGHCPHDERPDEVNGAIERWIQEVL
jgi:pimeloyl-ACP methyl ester carboxylesterase